MKTTYGFILLGCLLYVACMEAVIDPQVAILMDVKMMLNDSRDVLDEWREPLTDACGTISRVMCEDGEIISISLSSSGLAGVLSPSIGKLRSLKWLYLDDNNISGEIPQDIGNLSSLTILKLQKNQFNGRIPDSLGHLLELQILDLSDNLLSGNIPPSLSNIPSLNSIILAYNNLSGEIPDQLLDVSLYNYTGNHFNCGPYLMPCEGNRNNRGGSRKSNTLGVLLGSIGGAIALLVLICVLVLRRMRHRRGNVPGEHPESLALGHRRQFSLLDLEIATGNFSEENVIGVGSFAKVYKGILPGPENKAVAVKRLLKILNDGAFRREAELISAAVHRNVLSLIGYCVTETEQLLVYPFMENLSLSSRLKCLKQNELALDWPRRMQISLDVARGLEYLHDNCIPWIIHRDIKSANVLLDGNLEAVIGDFGLAKLMETKEEVTKVRGTQGYIAPEYLQTSKASKKTDVYAYGFLLLEIATGMGPCRFAGEGGSETPTQKLRRLKEEDRLEDIADCNLNTYDSNELAKIIDISLRCIQKEAAHRPMMADIVKMLEGSEMEGDGDVPVDHCLVKLPSILEAEVLSGPR